MRTAPRWAQTTAARSPAAARADPPFPIVPIASSQVLQTYRPWTSIAKVVSWTRVASGASISRRIMWHLTFCDTESWTLRRAATRHYTPLTLPRRWADREFTRWLSLSPVQPIRCRVNPNRPPRGRGGSRIARSERGARSVSLPLWSDHFISRKASTEWMAEISVGLIANLKLAATPFHHGDGRGFQSPRLNAVIHRCRAADFLPKM